MACVYSSMRADAGLCRREIGGFIVNLLCEHNYERLARICGVRGDVGMWAWVGELIVDLLCVHDHCLTRKSLSAWNGA